MPPFIDPIYSQQTVAALKQDVRAADYEWRASVRPPHWYDVFVQNAPHPYKRILDLGCGAGRLTLLLAAHADTGVGLDLSPTLLTLAQARQRALAQSNVTWLLGDIHHLPFTACRFDYIVSLNVLRLTDLPVVLPRLPDLLSPKGRIIVRDIVKQFPLPQVKLAAHLYATLKNMPSIHRMYGTAISFRIFHDRISRASRELMLRERNWSLEQVKEFYAGAFPGCRIEYVHSHITVIWDKPPGTSR